MPGGTGKKPIEKARMPGKQRKAISRVPVRSIHYLVEAIGKPDTLRIIHALGSQVAAKIARTYTRKTLRKAVGKHGVEKFISVMKEPNRGNLGGTEELEDMIEKRPKK